MDGALVFFLKMNNFISVIIVSKDWSASNSFKLSAAQSICNLSCILHKILKILTNTKNNAECSYHHHEMKSLSLTGSTSR